MHLPTFGDRSRYRLRHVAPGLAPATFDRTPSGFAASAGPYNGLNTIACGWFADVDSAFLARAIQEYVDHPEHRAQIGTAEELARLKALPPKAIEQTVTETWPKWLAGEGEQP